MKPSTSYQSASGSKHSSGFDDGRPRPRSFPYRGGKYRLAPKIIKLLPSHRIFVEVFGGAANILLAKPPSPIEVYNDRDGALVNLFETVRNHPLLFLERCMFLLYSRELFGKWSRELDTNFDGADVDKLEAAVRTYYSMVSGFFGDPTKGWAFDRTGKNGGADRWMSVWQRIASLSQRLGHVNIDCLDFHDCIRNWDTEETLFFLDPPYLGTVSSGYYDFTLQQHQELARVLRTVKGKWLMTYDDIPELRKMYNGFEIHRFSSKLSSQKIPKGAFRVDLRQILIANYQLEIKNEERG